MFSPDRTIRLSLFFEENFLSARISAISLCSECGEEFYNPNREVACGDCRAFSHTSRQKVTQQKVKEEARLDRTRAEKRTTIQRKKQRRAKYAEV